MATSLSTRRPLGLGVGLYSLRDAARLLRATPSLVGRWSRSDAGLIPRDRGQDRDLLTFAQLMELHFVKLFRDEGVSLDTIRAASRKAAEKYGADCPFSLKRFDTDGQSIFATLRRGASDEIVLEDVARGQYAFETILRPFFRKLEYRNEQALVRFWPLTKAGRVVLDPARRFGRPIDAETGVPTRAIVDALAAGGGQSRAEVARWLDIPVVAVDKAVEFERSLSK